MHKPTTCFYLSTGAGFLPSRVFGESNATLMTTPAFTSREVILTDCFTAEGATITLGRHIEGSRPSGFGI